MTSPSRRALLGFGALAGVGTVVGTAPAAVAATPSPLVLHGRGMRRLSGAANVGDTQSVRGVLAETLAGPGRGEVFHTGHVVSRAGDPSDVASVETHLFVFPEGTVAGSGTVTHAGRGTFVVTGGTGRYAGARGSYTSTQSADAAGGGAAEYRFALTTET